MFSIETLKLTGRIANFWLNLPTPGILTRRAIDGLPQLDDFLCLPTQGQRHNRVFVSGHGEMVPNANHAYESFLAHPPFAEQVFSFLFGPTP